MQMIGQFLAGHYKIVKVLGAGGFGKTYVAEDTHLPGNQRCVLKHLNPASNDPYVLDTARRLFQTEAEILQQLGTHEQIPRLLAYFEENQEFYLVQELINGYTLGEELPIGQKWNEEKIREMLLEVLKILSFVHSHGVIHRDIKPDNIIRRLEDRKLVLIDFGAIKQVRNQTVIGGTQANISVAIGTPGYMPTEQNRGKPRPSSDIYALGMIGIQALTGVYPNQLEEDAETGELLWQHLVISANHQFMAILQKMTRYHFKDRYQTVDEVLTDLNNLSSPQNLTPQPLPTAICTDVTQPGAYWQPDTVAVAPNYAAPPPAQASPGTRNSYILPIAIALGAIPVIGLLITQTNIFNQTSNSQPVTEKNVINKDLNQDLNTRKKEAEQVILNYYSNINNQEYSTAWNYLSAQHQNNSNSHPKGFNSFTEWWVQMAKVDVEYIECTDISSNLATVDTQLRYFLKSGKRLSPSVRYYLVWDNVSERWLINKVEKTSS